MTYREGEREREKGGCNLQPRTLSLVVSRNGGGSDDDGANRVCSCRSWLS